MTAARAACTGLAGCLLCAAPAWAGARAALSGAVRGRFASLPGPSAAGTMGGEPGRGWKYADVYRRAPQVFQVVEDAVPPLCA